VTLVRRRGLGLTRYIYMYVHICVYICLYICTAPPRRRRDRASPVGPESNFKIHRRFTNKGDTSTHAQETDPRVALGA